MEEIKSTDLFTFNGNSKVIDVYGKEIVKMPDYLIVLPYFKETNKVLMKYTEIPAFKYSFPHIDKWITAAKYSLKGECNKESVINAVKENFGMTIDIEPEILGPIFVDDMCTTKCYVCVLPLLEHEYSIEPVLEKKPVALNCSELANYIIYDLPSKYCLDVFKKEYSLY
jgi:hypothetical protein